MEKPLTVQSEGWERVCRKKGRGKGQEKEGKRRQGAVSLSKSHPVKANEGQMMDFPKSEAISETAI